MDETITVLAFAFCLLSSAITDHTPPKNSQKLTPADLSCQHTGTEERNLQASSQQSE